MLFAECLAAEGKSVATMMQITAEADRSIAFLYTYRGPIRVCLSQTKISFFAKCQRLL